MNLDGEYEGRFCVFTQRRREKLKSSAISGLVCKGNVVTHGPPVLSYITEDITTTTLSGYGEEYLYFVHQTEKETLLLFISLGLVTCAIQCCIQQP